eukprot:TRINITY_DN43187_c0_g1_i1.p1 TRINITY_DN43187_c0_g1~~TRINITY_DN43187_c0_g1_i1.p1  ORF type:complete len:425 (-),score=55.81 TRINITY_DN43187_c0_g1_i1:95-1210(-)
MQVRLENLTPFELDTFWVNPEGKEINVGTIEPRFSEGMNTFVGHAFRGYTSSTASMPRTLVFQKKFMEHDLGKYLFSIRSCGPVLEEQRINPNFDEGDGKIFEGLLHDHDAPCEPKDDSSKWSCVRFIPREEYHQRIKSNPHSFGFLNEEEAHGRGVGETADTRFVSHIPRMPRVTDGPGFRKMSFSPKLHELLTWFNEKVHTNMTRAKTVPGFYTNNHVYPFDEVNLDNFRDTHNMIKREMAKILQWWTQMHLRQTDTFGVRIYRRNAMLINHVDRDETHIASAVLQVAQWNLDKNGGWPLEILTPTGDCMEVYLQPGEMVLYEGGKFRHGRPMRFRGEGFANVFSHFAPVDWHGPDTSPDFEPIYGTEL